MQMTIIRFLLLALILCLISHAVQWSKVLQKMKEKGSVSHVVKNIVKKT